MPQSPVTIWELIAPLPEHFYRGVCPAKVFCMCSPILVTPRPGPPLLEAIGRPGPGGGAPDLNPPRFSTAGSWRGGSRPPAPAFPDPRPSRRISTAPLENTFAAGTPLWKCFSWPAPHDLTSQPRPPFSLRPPSRQISRRNLLSPPTHTFMPDLAHTHDQTGRKPTTLVVGGMPS